MSFTEHRWVRRLCGGRGRPAGLAILALLLVAVAVPGVPVLHAARLASFDLYQAMAPRRPVSAPAVIVAVDDGSIARYGQWPWPRTLLARLIRRVTEADPAVIGIDIVMSEPDRLSPARLPQLVPDLGQDIAERLMQMPDNEAALAAALGRARVVLGAAGVEGRADIAPEAGGGWTPMRVRGGDPAPFVRRFTGALRSIPQIDHAALGRGLLSADVERGVVRRLPAIANVSGTLVPGFALELLRVASGEPIIDVQMRRGVREVAFGDVRVPTEPDGSLRVHYSRHDRRRFVSAADLLAGMVPVDRLARKVVIVAVTAIGLADYQATPVIDRMPGAEIHAQAIENIFDGALLSRPPWARWAELTTLAIVGTLLVLVVPACPRRYSLLLFVGTLVVGAVAGFVLYRYALILVDVAAPAIAFAALFSVMGGITLAEADSQRRALHRQLEREREEAARVAGELEAARRIQMGMLPRPEDLTGNGRRYALFAVLEPARTVGGDLYDFFEPRPDRLFLLLGDVAGKGVPGCLFMAVSTSLFRATALRLLQSSATIMSEANREIARENAESLFVTVFAGILALDTGVLEYSNAGHEDPYVLRPGQPLSRLSQVGGPPLCVIDDFAYEADRHQFAAGDLLCLMTDGVVEAMSATGELYGRARLEAVLGGVRADATPASVCDAIRSDVARFTVGAEPADDLAILVVRWNGPARAT